jgi:hypothetical protein
MNAKQNLILIGNIKEEKGSAHYVWDDVLWADFFTNFLKFWETFPNFGKFWEILGIFWNFLEFFGIFWET